MGPMDPVDAENLQEDDTAKGADIVDLDEAKHAHSGPGLGPAMHLAGDGLSLQALMSMQGTTFEIDQEFDEVAEQRKYFNPEEIFNDEDEMKAAVPNWEFEEEEGRTCFEVMESKMEKLTDDGGVCKRVIKRGHGEIVPPTAFIQAHYDGYLEYADEPFDSSRFQNCVRRHKLGKGELIPGLEIGIQSMKKGELAQFLLKPDYAFGKLGCPPRIPADATILFQVELLEFTDKASADEFFSLTHEERKSVDFSLLLKVVEAEKKEGNEFFNIRVFGRALQKYKKAIDILENYHAKGDKDDTKRQNLLYKIYLNAGLTSLRLNKLGLACHYSKQSLMINEKSGKAYYIMGKAQSIQGFFEPARNTLNKARRLSPDSQDIIKAIEENEREKKKGSIMYKATCQKMFGLTDQDGASAQNSSASSAFGREKESEIDGDAQEISRDFDALIQETMQEFVENDTSRELPMPSQDYTAGEKSLVADVAKKMNLECKLVGEGRNVRIVIRKPVTWQK